MGRKGLKDEKERQLNQRRSRALVPWSELRRGVVPGLEGLPDPFGGSQLPIDYSNVPRAQRSTQEALKAATRRRSGRPSVPDRPRRRAEQDPPLRRSAEDRAAIGPPVS
ncbi:MAG: hypothetical protein R2710_01945 [Acidimicrobiales bacterium]